MQGTVMMLMALSGLGCHNRGCDVAYAAPTYSCYGGGCYANEYPSYVSPQSFTGCYTGGYSGCYASVYSGSCYGGGCFGGGCYGGGDSSCYSSCYSGKHHGCGLLAKLFGGCGNKHGHGHGYGGSYAYADFYGSPYGGYDLPYSPSMYGYSREFNYGTEAPGEAAMGYQGAGMGGTPTEAAPPVQATPAPTGTVSPVSPTPDSASPPAAPKPVIPATPSVPGDSVPSIPSPPKPNT